MSRTACVMLGFGLLCACDTPPADPAVSFCDGDARDAVRAMAEAHGGVARWQVLDSVYVEREHLFAGSDAPIRFDIHGDYPSHRIYQSWQSPPGTLAWDGEHGWSSGWPLAEQLMPRYVAGIGFTLVNLPWLAADESVELESRGCSGTLPGHGERRFFVVVAHYEPEPVRKPAWYDGPRDRYELYIDPDSHRLAGVMQHWSYAARLDAAGAPPEVDAISQLFVPETYAEAGGFVWPGDYAAYAPDGTLAARGRFFGYDLGRPFDEARLFPDASGSYRPDVSSSYYRRR